MATLSGDPNLQAQLAMNGGGTRPPLVSGNPPMGSPQRTGVRGQGGAIDATPKIVAAMLAGAVLTIFLLRLGGFRFSFGGQLGAS